MLFSKTDCIMERKVSTCENDQILIGTYIPQFFCTILSLIITPY